MTSENQLKTENQDDSGKLRPTSHLFQKEFDRFPGLPGQSATNEVAPLPGWLREFYPIWIEPQKKTPLRYEWRIGQTVVGSQAEGDA